MRRQRENDGMQKFSKFCLYIAVNMAAILTHIDNLILHGFLLMILFLNRQSIQLIQLEM